VTVLQRAAGPAAKRIPEIRKAWSQIGRDQL
jgi:hypothetical protein